MGKKSSIEQKRDREAKENFGEIFHSIRTDLQELVDYHKYQQNMIARGMQEISPQIWGERWPVKDPAKILSSIAKGQTKISLPLLELLMEVLPLTGREKRELTAVAMGIIRWGSADKNNVSTGVQKNSDLTLADVHQLLKAEMFPCLIADQYLNILFTYPSIMQLLGIEDDYVNQKSQQETYHYNLLHILFSDSLPAPRTKLGSVKDTLLLDYVYLYRACTVRYRNTKFFKNLHTYLKKQSEFRVFLAKSYYRYPMLHHSTTPLNFNEYKKQYYTNQVPLLYTTDITPILSPYGDLYIIRYSPRDQYTLTSFLKMREKNPRMRQCSKWETG